MDKSKSMVLVVSLFTSSLMTPFLGEGITAKSASKPQTVSTSAQSHYQEYIQMPTVLDYNTYNMDLFNQAPPKEETATKEVNNSIQFVSTGKLTLTESPKPGANPFFDAALFFVLRWEGGYSNHPDDHGGPTYRGITQARYDDYRKSKGLPARFVREIQDNELRDIYYSYYWLPVHGDELVYPLALTMFDTAVHCGPGAALGFMKQALNLADNNNWVQNLGSTLENMKANTSLTALQIMPFREEYYKNIVKRDATQGVFLTGWLNRYNDLFTSVNLWSQQNLKLPEVLNGFLQKGDLANAVNYTIESVKNKNLSVNETLALADALPENKRLDFYNQLICNQETSPELKAGVKGSLFSLANWYVTQKRWDNAAEYALSAIPVGASAKDIVGLDKNIVSETDKVSFYNNLIQSKLITQDVKTEVKNRFIDLIKSNVGHLSLALEYGIQAFKLGATAQEVFKPIDSSLWLDVQVKFTQEFFMSKLQVLPDDIRVEVLKRQPVEVSLDYTKLRLLPTNIPVKLNTIVTPSEIVHVAKWTSSDEKVVKVDQNGVVTPVGVGTATILLTIDEGKGKATCSVTVENSPAPAKPVPVATSKKS